MHIFPAIDLYDGKAVRLLKGDYREMTVYSEAPLEIAKDFENSGAEFLHMVDLEGAKTAIRRTSARLRKLCKAPLFLPKSAAEYARLKRWKNT